MYSKKNKKTKILFKILLFGLVCSILSATSSILWKIGSSNVSSFSSLIYNIPIILGFLLQGLGFGLYYYMLKHSKIYFVTAILSLNFIWVLVLAKIILHETISINKIIGSIIIISGIFFLIKDQEKLNSKHKIAKIVIKKRDVLQ